MTASAFVLCRITKEGQFKFEKGLHGQLLVFDHVAHAQEFIEEHRLASKWKIISVSVETFCDSTTPDEILQHLWS